MYVHGLQLIHPALAFSSSSIARALYLKGIEMDSEKNTKRCKVWAWLHERACVLSSRARRINNGRLKTFGWFVLLFLAHLTFKAIISPKPNPNPSPSITIIGKFPYQKGYTMEASIWAQSRKEFSAFFCPGSSNLMQVGADYCLSKPYYIPVKKLGCCEYQLTFTPDYFSKGWMNWESTLPDLVFKNKDGNPVGDISIALRHDWEGSDEFQCQIKPDNTLYCNGLVVPVGNKIYNKERGAYIFDFDF